MATRFGLLQDSTTYQAIFEEGRQIGVCRGYRRFLLLGGTKQFGSLDQKTEAVIESIDSEELSRLFDRLFEVSSWEDLLA